MSQFVKYLRQVTDTYDDSYPNLRWGQAYFNVLCSHDPELADKIRSTQLDPFYSDKQIPDFLNYIATHWND